MGTVTRSADPRFEARALHRWLFGSEYRDLWTTPVEVDVLDLASFGGGLTPTQRGGGLQTASLRFDAANGRQYSFRLIEKDPSAILDPKLLGTFVQEVVQDQISAAHPYGALVAAPLLEAVDVLHPSPLLFLMPDDPLLGAFREEFGGALGMIEERPDENDSALAAFHGADLVIGSDRLFDRVQESPQDRVDSRAFLAARLMDIYLGDWDRHRDQWRWARFDDGPTGWQPIPRDRDQAFAKFDGQVLSVAKNQFLGFVVFGDEYPNVVRLHWNAREVDRRFLTDLEWPVWDSVTTALGERLSNDVIERAVGQLPPEIAALNGDALAGALKKRRDALHGVAADFYELLAREVDVHGTDKAERVQLARLDDGGLDVALFSEQTGPDPYYRRRFRADETKEVRVYLRGGDDHVKISGSGRADIRIRLIGGPGADRVDSDESKKTRLYDFEGDNEVSGANPIATDEKVWKEWRYSEVDRNVPRDWGSWWRPLVWTAYTTDLGLFIGGGAERFGYGFRKRPVSSHISFRVGLATTPMAGRGEFVGRWNTQNSGFHYGLRAWASGLDVLRFHGFGNDTPADDDGDFFKVIQRRAILEPGLGLELESGWVFAGGLTASYSSEGDNQDRNLGSAEGLYGRGDFGQAGVVGEIRLDARDNPGAPMRGVYLVATGRMYPEIMDVESAFGRTEAEFRGYIGSKSWPGHVLAVRIGGARVWGTPPWFDAAFLGGPQNLRGWDIHRFSGDRSAYGSAEARIHLGRARIFIPGALGLYGFGDAGRVWFEDESPGGWHLGYGGGVSFAPLDPVNTVSVGVSMSEEATKLLVVAGFAF